MCDDNRRVADLLFDFGVTGRSEFSSFNETVPDEEMVLLEMSSFTELRTLLLPNRK